MATANIISAPPRFLSVRAAARRLKSSERQVTKWLATGQLVPFVELGRSLKVEPASVERLAAELGIDAPAPSPERGA